MRVLTSAAAQELELKPIKDNSKKIVGLFLPSISDPD
jgi:hypothetical protein